MGVMDRYEEKKKKSSTSVGKSTSGGVAERFALNQYYKTLDIGSVDESYINTFANSTSDFFDRFSSDSFSYGEATKTISDLRTRYDTIQGWLSQNKSKLDESSYSNVSSYLNDVKVSLDSVNDYYSQWETEDAYNQYMAVQKDKAEKLTFDLNAGKKELDDITAKKNHADAIRSTIDTLNWQVNEGDSSTETQLRLKALQEELKQYDGIDALYTQKTQYYNQAKHLQGGEKLKNDAVNASDFEEYAQKGAEIKNPTKDDAEGLGISIGGLHIARLFADEIGNEVTYSRENWEAIAEGEKQGRNMVGDSVYHQMTDGEVKIYNYYLAKYGKDKADEYLYSIGEDLNARQGGMWADEAAGNLALQYLLGANAGVDQFTSGVKSIFSDEDYINTTALQYAGQMVREDLADAGPQILGSSLGQIGYDIVNTTANMAPSILASTIVSMVATPAAGAAFGSTVGTAVGATAGQLVGAGVLGASAGGNAYAEKLNAGYSKEQAAAYGKLVGASEAGLEFLMGGISKLGGKVTGKSIEAIANNIDNAVGRVALKWGMSMLSEGAEEYLQEVLTPWYENIVFNMDNDVRLLSEEALYAGLLGALSAGVLESVDVVSGDRAMTKYGKELQKDGLSVERLKELGQTFAADTVAYKLAGKVDEKTSAYTLARLFNEVNAQLTEQNKADIVKSLERKGIATAHAETIANQLAAAVDGAEFGAAQRFVLEHNEDIAKTFYDVIVNANSTVNQRRVQSTTSLFDLANEQAQAYVQQKYAPTAMQKKSAEEYKADAAQRVKDMTARPATESYTPSQDEAVGPLSMEELARRVAAAKSMTAADVAAAKVADAEKKAMGSFTASDSGKAVQKSTGTEIGKMEIVSTEGKKLKLKTEDGKVVDGNDVSFPSKGVAMVYNAVKEMGVSPVVAQSLVDNYDGGDGMVYAADVKLAYQYGKMNFPKSYLEQLDIKPYQAEHAYKLGRSDAKAAKAKTRRTTQYKRGSLIYESEIDEATLTPRKKASLDGLKMLADLSSLNIHVFESTLTKDGFHFTAKDGTVIGANGVYRTGTNDIWVDINSGNFGQGLAIHTAAHEISHYIKQWSPVKWQAMADFLLEQYGEEGVPVEALLQTQMDKVRKSKPNLKDNALMDEAYEELVSDALSEMLVDGKVVEKMQALKRKDHQLWEKIKEAIKDLLDRWGLISKEYEGVIPEAGEAQALREMDKAFKKLQDMYAEAFADADANFSEAEVSTDTAPVEASSKNSFRSLAEAAGFAALELEDGTRVFLKDRQRVSKVTLNDIENSPIGAMINFSLEMKDITAADAKRQKEMFRDLCNMAIKTGDFGMTMQFAGSAVFTGMKANADKQYGTTYDFPSICTKTQAVIDAMSARMVKLGRGLSSDEIVEIYREVFASGNPVPCPECYVFSRWIGIGGLLDNIKSYQETYGKMSVQEAAAAYDKLHKQIEEIAEEKGISFGKAKGKLASELQKEYNKLKERIEKAQNQGEKVKPADEKRLADLEPMMTTVKALTWLENVYFADEKHTKVNKNFRVPDNILFDLNNGEAFATQYKEAWAFRTTQGAGYGKAITPYAEARLGEGILVTNNTTNTIKGKAKGTLNNYFLEQKGTMDDKAVAALKKARAKQKNQAFIGGQRFQSTSDARYENASDYLLAALEMQAMGGMVQVYTKVDGAVPAFSAWGFSINQSLMPLGGGLDADGNVRDTSTGGMNPKVAFRNRDKHETAGTITIGVNDNHIRAMFAQWERDFIIPYHASGGKATVVAEFRDIQEKREAKGAKVRSTDYSRTQSDKVLSDEVLRWMGKSEEDIRQIHAVRDARIAILTGKSPDMEVVRANRFLSNLYDKVRVKGGEWYGVTLAKGKVEGQIFPNEFWDQSVSYENSAKVTADYLAYCEDLGVLHRFSGMIPQNGILRPATGYNENGERVQLTDLAYKYKDGEKTAEVEPFFWKVLTDRRMYDNSRHYLPQKRVTLNDTTTETVTTFATGNYGRQYDAALSAETAARLADAKLSDRDAAAVELSDINTKFSIRDEAPPKNTIYAYKAFYAHDGKLYPPMVANLSEEQAKITGAVSGTLKALETPVGVWINADVGGIATYSDDVTEYEIALDKAKAEIRKQLKKQGFDMKSKTTKALVAEEAAKRADGASKTTVVHKKGEVIRNTTGRLAVQNAKSGGDATLAFRPGWHLGEWPDAKQFNKDSSLGKRSVMPDSLVFCLCEIAADVDYQLDAMSYGVNERGKFDRTQAGLPRVPVDGYYKYRTNVDPSTAPWYITGAMRVVEVLDDADCARICAEYGVTPDPRESGKPIDLAAYGLKRGPVVPAKDLARFKKNQKNIDNEAMLERALTDPAYAGAYVQRDIDFDDPEIVKEFERNRQSADEYREKAGAMKLSDRDVVENSAGSAYTNSTDKEKGDVYADRQSNQGSARSVNTTGTRYDSGRDSGSGGATLARGVSSLTDEQRRRIGEVILRALDSTPLGRRGNISSVVDSITSVVLGSREFDQMLTECYPGLKQADIARIREIAKPGKKLLAKPTRTAEDRAYFAALKTDKMKAAAMVKQVAQKAGYLLKQFHFTDADFTVFRFGELGFHVGTRAQAEYVGRGKQGKILNLYIKADNPLYWPIDIGYWSAKEIAATLDPDDSFEEFENAEEIRDKIREIGQIANGQEANEKLINYLRTLGYDSIKYENTQDREHGDPIDESYILFDPEQLKSADLVTYDDNHSPIPLSQRFDSKMEDYRFSDRDPDSVSNRSLLANAFMDVAQNDTERSRITEYKKKVSLMEEQEKKLQDIRGQLRDLSFAPGSRDQAKIRKLRDEATKISNRIDIYDKQLLRLEASAPLMAVLEREKKLAYSRASQKWADRMETARTGRNKTEMRHKVQKVVGELNDLLLHGSKDKHVMIGLQKATAEALNAINMDTVAAEERLAKIQAKIDKSTNPAEIAQLRQTYARIEEQGMNMTARLTALKNAYEDIKDSGDPLVANAYHPEIEDRIKNLRKLVGDTPLRNMSMEQLEFTYDTYRMVLTTIRNANKAFKNAKGETIAVLGNRSMEEIAAVGGKKTLAMKAMQGPLSFAWSGLKPVYAFKAIGSNTLSEMFGQIRAGEDTWAVDVSDAKEFYREKAKQFHYDSWDLNKQYSFTSKTGKEFKLTLEQIMSLYAYSKRKQADAHLDKGGFVFDDAIEVTQKKHGIPVKYTVKTADAHNLSAETLQAICKTLTKEQAQFVDEMQEYLSTTMGEKGNEVSLAMYGVKLFKEKFYFPLKSAKQYMFEQNEVAGEVKIKNSGFSKETVQHASNPVILSNFTDVWAEHVNDMSMYHAFVLPLEDFNRVFNYKTPNSANMDTESVKMYLQNAYGRQPEQYIKSLLTDLNGGARSDPNAGIINKGIGMFKKAAVFASLSVVVQQPSAIARAAAYIDTKYFVGKPGTKTWDEVKKYAPVAIIKEMGYFDTNMGVSTVDFIKAKEYEGTKAKMKALVTDSQFRDEALSKAPAVADELAWCQIWEAVKKEVADRQGLSGEELLQAAGKRFTEVIVNTQVYDSVLSRSGLMRSKDTGMKMATAFMAEPTTSLNMITDAIIQGKRGDKSYARKAIGSVVASMIINSILVSFVYAGRDDDEDKTYLEKYVGTLTGELIDSFNPLQLIPFVKDIVSIMQGYDVERSDMAVVTDLYKAWKNLSSDKRSVYRKVEDFGGAVAAIFGLPVKNIMRDVRGIYNTAMSFFNGEETTGRGVGEAVRAAVTGNERSNSDQLYSAMVNGDTKQAERIKSRFKDERSVVYAIRDGLVANDKRITKAAEARVAGNQTEYMRLAREIVKEGHFSQDDVVRAINYVTDKLRKGETETSSAVSSPDTFKMEDYFNEVVSRDQAEANVVKREIIAGLVADGKTEAEAEKSFNNSFKNSAVKPAFEGGDISESEAIAMLRDYGGFDEDAAKADVQYWAFKQDYPDIYVDDSWFDSYYEYAADVNIPIDVYMNYRNTVKSITGDGKKARRMAVINSLPLTYAQKDALYYSEGWTASTIYEAPWH